MASRDAAADVIHHRQVGSDDADRIYKHRHLPQRVDGVAVAHRATQSLVELMAICRVRMRPARSGAASPVFLTTGSRDVLLLEDTRQ
jgi:hypothetical protein